jgi:hypothetical protein
LQGEKLSEVRDQYLVEVKDLPKIN